LDFRNHCIEQIIFTAIEMVFIRNGSLFDSSK